MPWSHRIPTLATLILLGGCNAELPEEASSVREQPALEGQASALGGDGFSGLDLSAVDLAASCDATTLTLSAAVKNEKGSGIAGSRAGIYAGATRLGVVEVPFLVGGERFPFQLTFTVPEGTTQVSVVADDDLAYPEDNEANNTASITFTVPCSTNQEPDALCKDVVVAADDTCQASASVDNGSHDPDGFPNPVTVVQSPAGPYGLGSTPVQLTVSDGMGTQTCSATVTVVDTTAPVPGASRNLVLQPSAGSDYTLVNLSDCALPPADNCGGAMDLQQSATLVRVSSDEGDDALSLLRLLACDDVQLSADRKSALVRAESALLGNGRVYTFTYEVKDAAGNASTGTCKVRVPALLGNPAVDSGTAYCQGEGCPPRTGSRGLCALL
ncbi:CARDB domain-containing protein [Pyxidicoccus sp. 3LG]